MEVASKLLAIKLPRSSSPDNPKPKQEQI